MPRNPGTKIYTLPVGTGGSPNTPISSSMFNAFVGDIAQDLNTARPIAMGGTDATNATAARANLGADNASNLIQGTLDDARLPYSMSQKQIAGNLIVNTGGSVFIDNDGDRDLILRSAAGVQRGILASLAGGGIAIQLLNSSGTFLKQLVLPESGNANWDGGNIWTSANDGPGSGLDADVLDGMQPSVSGTASTIVQRRNDGVVFGNAFVTDGATNSGAFFFGSNGAHSIAYDGTNYVIGAGALVVSAGSVTALTEMEVTATGSGNTQYWHKLNGVRRGLTYFDATGGSMNWIVYNSGGSSVASLALSPAGVLTASGSIVASTNITSTSGFIQASGRVYSGGGASFIETDGNISFSGSMASGFNGTLSGALSARQLALGYTPVQQGTGVSQLSNAVKIGWSAASKVRVQIDGTDFGSTWPIDIGGNAATATSATSATNATNATNASNSAALGGVAAENYAQFSYSSNQNETVFPLGQTMIAQGTPVNRRVSTVNLYLDAGGVDYNTSPGGTGVSGSWAQCGRATSTACLFQRVA